MQERPWYAEGLRFSCTQCGNCCRAEGEYEYIYVREPEVEAPGRAPGPRHRGIPRASLRRGRRLDDHQGGRAGLPVPRCERALLGVRSAPDAVRTWPFWDENLKQPTWEGTVRKRCPGVGQGRLYSADEVEGTVRMNDEWYMQDE